MSTKRNSYTPEQKLKIILEVIRGDQTLAQIASKYQVHSTQIIRWKKQLLTSAPAMFSDARRRKEQDAKDENIQQLINDLGQAQHELNFFKKSWLFPTDLKRKIILEERLPDMSLAE